MSDLYANARLHHKTVGNYQMHLPKRVISEHRSSTITRIRIDPRVWDVAIALADGDSSRIQVRSETEVLVVNQTKRRNA